MKGVMAQELQQLINEKRLLGPPKSIMDMGELKSLTHFSRVEVAYYLRQLREQHISTSSDSSEIKEMRKVLGDWMGEGDQRSGDSGDSFPEGDVDEAKLTLERVIESFRLPRFPRFTLEEKLRYFQRISSTPDLEQRITPSQMALLIDQEPATNASVAVIDRYVAALISLQKILTELSEDQEKNGNENASPAQALPPLEGTSEGIADNVASSLSDLNSEEVEQMPLSHDVDAAAPARPVASLESSLGLEDPYSNLITFLPTSTSFEPNSEMLPEAVQYRLKQIAESWLEEKNLRYNHKIASYLKIGDLVNEFERDYRRILTAEDPIFVSRPYIDYSRRVLKEMLQNKGLDAAVKFAGEKVNFINDKAITSYAPSRDLLDTLFGYLTYLDDKVLTGNGKSAKEIGRILSSILSKRRSSETMTVSEAFAEFVHRGVLSPTELIEGNAREIFCAFAILLASGEKGLASENVGPRETEAVMKLLNECFETSRQWFADHVDRRMTERITDQARRGFLSNEVVLELGREQLSLPKGSLASEVNSSTIAQAANMIFSKLVGGGHDVYQTLTLESGSSGAFRLQIRQNLER
jgi:hypothetical protein